MIKDIEAVTLKRKIAGEKSLKNSTQFQRSESRQANAYLTGSIKLASTLENVRQSTLSIRRNLKITADIYGFKVSHGKVS